MELLRRILFLLSIVQGYLKQMFEVYEAVLVIHCFQGYSEGLMYHLKVSEVSTTSTTA